MPTPLVQALIAQNGKYIVLPPWNELESDLLKPLTIPDPYDESTSQGYPIATKFVDFDRVFKYGLSTSALNEGWGAMTKLDEKETGTLDANVAAGGRSFTVTGVAAFVVNYYSGGWIMLKEGDGYMYRIESNTVNSATDSVTVVIEKPDGVTVALTTSATFILFQNEYRDLVKASTVTGGAAGNSSFVGVPISPITSGYYHWTQTDGVAWVAAAGSYGSTTHQRGFFFWTDGSLALDSSGESGQYAGHSLPFTNVAGSSANYVGGNIHLNLQLTR